jgi:hypothetical protein
VVRTMCDRSSPFGSVGDRAWRKAIEYFKLGSGKPRAPGRHDRVPDGPNRW